MLEVSQNAMVWLVRLVFTLTISIQLSTSLSSKLKCRNIREYGEKWFGRQSPTCIEFSPNRQSILTVVPRGQLGNHLHAYALLSSLQQHYPSYQFSLASETRLYLSTYFNTSKLLMPSIDNLCLCKSHRGVASRPWNVEFRNSEPGTDFVKVSDQEFEGIVP